MGIRPYFKSQYLFLINDSPPIFTAGRTRGLDLTEKYIVQVGMAPDYSPHYSWAARALGYKSVVILPPTIEARAAALNSDYFELWLWRKNGRPDNGRSGTQQDSGQG